MVRHVHIIINYIKLKIMDLEVTFGLLGFLFIVALFTIIIPLIKKEAVDWNVVKAFGKVIVASVLVYLFLEKIIFN